MKPPPPTSTRTDTRFPTTTLFRSRHQKEGDGETLAIPGSITPPRAVARPAVRATALAAPAACPDRRDRDRRAEAPPRRLPPSRPCRHRRAPCRQIGRAHV